MLVRLGIEAYYGLGDYSKLSTENKAKSKAMTDCYFMKPMKYALSIKVCGDELFRVRDRSPLELNVTLGEGKDIAIDFKDILRNYSVSNP